VIASYTACKGALRTQNERRKAVCVCVCVCVRERELTCQREVHKAPLCLFSKHTFPLQNSHRTRSEIFQPPSTLFPPLAFCCSFLFSHLVASIEQKKIYIFFKLNVFFIPLWQIVINYFSTNTKMFLTFTLISMGLKICLLMVAHSFSCDQCLLLKSQESSIMKTLFVYGTKHKMFLTSLSRLIILRLKAGNITRNSVRLEIPVPSFREQGLQ